MQFPFSLGIYQGDGDHRKSLSATLAPIKGKQDFYRLDLLYGPNRYQVHFKPALKQDGALFFLEEFGVDKICELLAQSMQGIESVNTGQFNLPSGSLCFRPTKVTYTILPAPDSIKA